MDSTQLVFPYELYQMLFKLSFLHLIPAIISLINYPVYSIFLWLSFITSINHWRYPLLHSWRRYIDIIIVNFTLLFTLYLSYRSKTKNYYLLFAFCAIVSFIGSWYYYIHQEFVISTFLHILVHLYGFVGNAILFSTLL